MKQFAFALAALLSTSALADHHDKPFVVKLAYESAEDLFLGLEVDNAATLKLPCASRGRDDCTGWELSATKNPAEFDDFEITRMEKTTRRKTFHYFELLAD